MSAQNDVTTFLGIPVDGFKSEMKQKLVSKGFVPKKVGTNEFLEGEFNGTDVHVYIATNNIKCIESCCVMQTLKMRRI